jgi:Endonuclease/Exonuclease/phosphatase family
MPGPSAASVRKRFARTVIAAVAGCVLSRIVALLLGVTMLPLSLGTTTASGQTGPPVPPPLDRIEVSLTEVATVEGRLRVVGDARNTTHPGRAVTVELRLDNNPVGRATTTPPSPRFARIVDARPATSLCVVPTGGVGAPACRALVFNATPTGHLDRFSPLFRGPFRAGGVRIAGWALDPDTTGPIPVIASIDGVPIARFVADAPRPDVGAAFPGLGDQHGFDTTIDVRAGKQLCVEAVNDHGPNFTIACRSLQPAIIVKAAGNGRPAVPLTSGANPPGYFRARRGDTVRLAITGSGGHFAMRQLTVETTKTLVCVTAEGDEIATRQQSSSEHRPKTDRSRLIRTSSITTRRTIRVPSVRKSCRPDRFRDLRLRIRVAAENNLGSVTRDEAVITSFGPDVLRIGTFNMESTGDHDDDAYERWARELGRRADVLALSEVKRLSRVETVARAGGFPYFVKPSDQKDLAILSRGPIMSSDFVRLYPEGGKERSGSNNLAAITELGGYPHQIIATHWAINDANHNRVDPSVALPGHFRAARWVVNRLATPRFAPPPNASTFVAGDMNAFSGYANGPEQPGGSTPAMQLLASRMTDALRHFADDNKLNNPDGELNDPGGWHRSDKRIDYVFSTGSYVPILYESWSEGPDAPFRVPSDHPYVLVTYEIQNRPAPPSGPAP